jgi:hypothetical protein
LESKPSAKVNGPEVVGPVDPKNLTAVLATTKPAEDRFKLTPSQHLFSQLVVQMAGAIVGQQGINRITKATAKDIVTAARNLAEAIEEV